MKTNIEYSMEKYHDPNKHHVIEIISPSESELLDKQNLFCAYVVILFYFCDSQKWVDLMNFGKGGVVSINGKGDFSSHDWDGLQHTKIPSL